jgi:hypothetical protein
MPRLLSQILLAVLMFPLGFIVYIAVYAMVGHYLGWSSQIQANVIAGFVTWALAGLCWFWTWRPTIVWNKRRMRRTLVAVAVALLAGIVIGGMGWTVDQDLGAMLGSAAAPLAWLAASVVAWRETDEERAKRLGKLSAEDIVCPTCGYSLTGLTEARCPECGTQYTLSELLASQPGREVDQLR